MFNKRSHSSLVDVFAEIEASYDFSQFSLDHFADWVAARRNRPIHRVPWKMPGHLSGTWLCTPDEDWIFFEQDTVAVHRVHIQLHELAHMLCGHHARTITLDFLRGMLSSSLHNFPLRLRSAYSDQHEDEAEHLTELIQATILRKAHIQALTSALAVNQATTEMYEALGLKI